MKYELIQDRLGRPLCEQLRIWKSAGVPATAAARLLALETRVRVTGETIRCWYREIGSPNGLA